MKTLRSSIGIVLGVIVLALILTPVLQVAAQPVTATLQLHRADSSGGIVNFPAGEMICLDITLPEGIVFNQCFTGIHPSPDSTFGVPYVDGHIYTATISSNTTACAASVVQPVLTITEGVAVAYMELRTDCPPEPPPFVNATVQIHREDASGADIIFPAGEQICIGMNWTVAGVWQQCYPSIYSGSDGFFAGFPYDSAVTYMATLDSNTTGCTAEVTGPTISGSGADTVLYIVLKTTCPASYYEREEATVQVYREDATLEEFIFPDGGQLCMYIPFPAGSGYEQCFTSMIGGAPAVQPGIPWDASFDYKATITSNTTGCEATLTDPTINIDLTPPVISYTIRTSCEDPVDTIDEPAPTDPTEPTSPTIPVGPTSPPADPVELTDPIDEPDPTSPTVPVVPTNPIDATDPVSPDPVTNSGTTVTHLPNTGIGVVDGFVVVSAIALVTGALVSIVALWIRVLVRR